MKAFQVTKSGMFTTIQDRGRYGYLRYGVPVSGAMDQCSLTAANCLISNDSNSACIETTLIGPELQALARTQIAVTGGQCSPMINGYDVPMWQTLEVEGGDTISFGRMESGCRAYLAVRGGIDAPMILGSRSTYVRGKFGGLGGRQLKTGDVIETTDASFVSTECLLPEELVPQFEQNICAHVILGPQAEMFTEKGLKTLLSEPYKVTPESDRMGYRLEGPAIEHKDKADIVSDALLPGVIQVPKSGKPILIMRDAQTTGGYPKIAVAIPSDLWRLGQARPNNEVRFVQITLREARQRLTEHNRTLGNLSNMLIRNRKQNDS